jgi:uncharacterized membrane protein
MVIIVLNMIAMTIIIVSIVIVLIVSIIIIQHNDNHDYHDSNFDKTTNLYKELTDSNIDQDVLFFLS